MKSRLFKWNDCNIAYSLIDTKYLIKLTVLGSDIDLNFKNRYTKPMMYLSQNPYTQEKLHEFECDLQSVLTKKVQLLHDGFLDWSQKSYEYRAELFIKFAKVLEDQEQACAEIISVEMGKPIHEARREIQKCCRVIDYFVAETPNLLLSVSRPQVTVQPLGVVLGIMPWNFPFWQALRLIIPSVLMGNTCLIKHAPNVPQCTQLLIRLMHESGFDESIVNYTFLSNEQAMALIGDSRIVGVSLTGSERAGRAVAEVAGRELKPIVLELGGSDPFIVCEDANLDEAIDTALAARFGNAGQVCISAKRFIVHESLKTEFSERLVEKVKKINMGNPLDEKTLMGPLARKDLQTLLTQQVSESIDSGDHVVFQESNTPQTDGFIHPQYLNFIT